MSSSDKLLAEWFWIDRWTGSSAFGLPIDARGLYREMLTQAWWRGAQLPNDHEQVRRLTAVTLKEWKRCWPLVERFWRVDGKNLVNDTQLVIYGIAKARANGASHRGQSGAAKRWGKRNAQASLEDSPPISDLQVPISQTLFVPKRDTCTYCGATVQETGFAFELDHFIPKSAGGSDAAPNRFWACHVCNRAKYNRVFQSLEECRNWLHRTFWTSKRKQYVSHRIVAFGGQPPADISTTTAWRCSHDPRCTERWRCHQKTEIERFKREAS